jgi:hypothetical protein
METAGKGPTVRVKGPAFWASFVWVLSLLPGCGHNPPAPTATPGAAASSAGGKTLLEQKCGLCHPASWALGFPSTMDEWTRLVRGKQGRKADWISDEEAAAIIDSRRADFYLK